MLCWFSSTMQEGAEVNWREILTQPYGAAVECMETNYYGPKKMVEAFIELLQCSDSPRIVNVSSAMGKLKASTVVSRIYKIHSYREPGLNCKILTFPRFDVSAIKSLVINLVVMFAERLSRMGEASSGRC